MRRGAVDVLAIAGDHSRESPVFRRLRVGGAGESSQRGRDAPGIWIWLKMPLSRCRDHSSGCPTSRADCAYAAGQLTARSNDEDIRFDVDALSGECNQDWSAQLRLR